MRTRIERMKGDFLLLPLIAEVNQSIKASQKMQSLSTVKQFEHQKNKFVKKLNEILNQKFKLALAK